MSDKENRENKTVSKTTVSTGVVVATSVALLSVSALMAVGVANLSNNLKEEYRAANRATTTASVVAPDVAEVDTQAQELTSAWSEWVRENSDRMNVEGELSVKSLSGNDLTRVVKFEAWFQDEVEQVTAERSTYTSDKTVDFGRPFPNQLSYQELTKTVLSSDLPVQYEGSGAVESLTRAVELSEDLVTWSFGDFYQRDGKTVAKYTPEHRAVAASVRNHEEHKASRRSAMGATLWDPYNVHIQAFEGESHDTLQVTAAAAKLVNLYNDLTNIAIPVDSFPADEVGTLTIVFEKLSQEPTSLEFLSNSVKLNLQLSEINNGQPFRTQQALGQIVTISDVQTLQPDTTKKMLAIPYTVAERGVLDVVTGTVDFSLSEGSPDDVLSQLHFLFVQADGDIESPDAFSANGAQVDSRGTFDSLTLKEEDYRYLPYFVWAANTETNAVQLTKEPEISSLVIVVADEDDQSHRDTSVLSRVPPGWHL